MNYVDAKKIALEHVCPQRGEFRRDIMSGEELRVVDFVGQAVRIKVSSFTNQNTTNTGYWNEYASGWAKKVRKGLYQ